MLGSVSGASTPQRSGEIGSDQALIAGWLERFTTVVARDRYGQAAAELTSELQSDGLTLATATLPDVQRAVQRVAERSKGAPSRHVPQMTSLLAYAYHRRHIQFDPTDRIRVLRPTQKVRFSRVDFARMYSIMPARDQIVSHLIYVAGVRPALICSLTWSDVKVSADGGVTIVVEKGGSLSLPSDLARHLLSTRCTADVGAPLFTVSGSTSPITLKSMNGRIKRAARRAGFKNPITASTLWHASLDRMDGVATAPTARGLP
jgi:site-specific recombinase XerD